MIGDIPGKLKEINKEQNRLRQHLKDLNEANLNSEMTVHVYIQLAFNNGQMNILRELL